MKKDFTANWNYFFVSETSTYFCDPSEASSFSFALLRHLLEVNKALIKKEKRQKKKTRKNRHNSKCFLIAMTIVAREEVYSNGSIDSGFSNVSSSWKRCSSSFKDAQAEFRKRDFPEKSFHCLLFKLWFNFFRIIWKFMIACNQWLGKWTMLMMFSFCFVGWNSSVLYLEKLKLFFNVVKFCF